MTQLQPTEPPGLAPVEKIAYSSDNFDIRPVDKTSFEEVVQILKDVQAAQNPDEKHFIKPQSLRDLYRLCARGTVILASIEKSSGKIAGVLLITPNDKADYHENLSKYPQQVKESGTGIISSVAATIGYRGQAAPLLAAAEPIAKEKMGLVAVFSKVAKTNGASNYCFNQADYVAAYDGIDPDMGYQVTFYRKSLGSLAPTGLPVLNEPHEFEPAAEPRYTNNVFAFPPPECR